MGKLQFRRGNKSVLPTGDSGEPLLATDSGQLFIGTPTGNVEAQLKGSTTDYTIYVATSALGGIPSASGATGKAIRTATATSTTANKLVDSTASFASATHLNKPVWNSTDDTWAKITAVDSATQCSLSADIMASGEGYVISNAFDNIPEAFNVADAGYNANITLRIAPGTFSNVLTLIGKTAGAAKTLTMQGSTTGTTTVSGETSIYQKISLKNITFTKRVYEYFGADVDWTTCVTSGDDGFLLLKSTSVANTFRTSSVIVIENDPAVYTSISSTVTKGYTIYVATSTYGGSDATGDGLKITQGSATSTSASKLVDSTANFNSTDHLNKTLYNSTDDTWAQITAIDSTTQVSISADIMASGESYVIANAVATIQKAIDLIPGTVNCNTTVKVSDGTFTENVIIKGKAFSGTFSILPLGTNTILDSLTAAASTQGSGATQGTVVRNAGTWTSNQRQNKWVKFTSGANSGTVRVIDSNDTTTLTIVHTWPNAVGVGDTFVVQEPATIINGNTGIAITASQGQLGLSFTGFYITNNSASIWNTGVNGLASLTLTNCGLYASIGQEVYINTTGSFVATQCVILSPSGSNGINNWGSVAVYRSKLQGVAGSVAGIVNSYLAFAAPRNGTVIDTYAQGLYSAGNSAISAAEYNRIRNCTTGCYAVTGGKILDTINLQYSGNTTDENAVAGSYGYID